MTIRKYAVQGTVMVLCSEHANLAAEAGDIEQMETVPGAKWTCRVCTIGRRLTGDPLDAVHAILNGHIVTRTPLGATYCDCMAWRFQNVPADQRSCKHTEAYSRDRHR